MLHEKYHNRTLELLFFFPVFPCIFGSGGLMCACGARWTLSWVRDCGLFCRRHLGLHMVQQTVVREAGGHVGGHPYGGLSPIYSMGHRHKWQNKRLAANPAKTNARLSLHKQGAHPPLWKPWLTSVKGECVLQHSLISVWPKGNYIDEKESVPLMINHLPPEVQLPVLWRRHCFIAILTHRPVYYPGRQQKVVILNILL